MPLPEPARLDGVIAKQNSLLGKTGLITNRCSCQNTMISGLPLFRRFCSSARPVWRHLKLATKLPMIAASVTLSKKEPAEDRIRRFNMAFRNFGLWVREEKRRV